MSSEDRTKSATRRRPISKPEITQDSNDMTLHERSSRTLSTSLDSIHVSPRTSSRSERSTIDEEYVMDEIEINGHAKDFAYSESEDDGAPFISQKPSAKSVLSSKDKRGMVLLVVLCEC